MKYIKKTKGKEGKLIESPFTFPSKDEEQKYIEICRKIWGCIPCDIDWAINTKPYKEYNGKKNI